MSLYRSAFILTKDDSNRMASHIYEIIAFSNRNDSGVLGRLPT